MAPSVDTQNRRSTPENRPPRAATDTLTAGGARGSVAGHEQRLGPASTATNRGAWATGLVAAAHRGDHRRSAGNGQRLSEGRGHPRAGPRRLASELKWARSDDRYRRVDHAHAVPGGGDDTLWGGLNKDEMHGVNSGR